MKTQRIVRILLLMVGFLQGCNQSETSETNLQEASKSFEEQKYQESLIYLKKALKSKPSDPEIRKRLGEVWLKLGDPNACIEHLKKAQDLRMPDNEVTLSLAQCYFYKKDFEQLDALDFSENMLEVSNRDYAILSAYKAQAALVKNESSKAYDHLQRAELLMAEEPMVLLSKAQWLIYEKQFQEALHLLDKVTAQSPNNAQAWGLKGDLYRFQQKTSKAEEAYTKALQNPVNKLDQINYFLYRSLVRIYLNKLDQAQEDIVKLQKLKAQHHGLHYVNGLLALAKKDFPQAIQNFQKVLEQDENFIYTHYFIGLTHVLTKNYHSARDHLIRFTRARPSHVLGQKMLGFVELQLQDYNHAKSRLEKVKELNQKDSDVYHMLGQIYIKEGDIEQGANYLSKAQTLEPKNAEMTLKLGIAQMDLGNTYAASGAFDQVLSQIPNHKDTLLLKFINEFKAKHYPAAMELAKTYTQTHPKDPLGFNLQGMVYVAKNQTQQADDAFHAALKLAPHDPNAHTHLAMLSLKKRDVTQAIAHYKKILERHQHTLSMLKLAKIYLKETRDESEAVKLLELAIKSQ
ncbi:MAG TPA: XrtA/PEP-CTERM system TPR-repeat protein PrsT, partial [Gammaproteobacteria bacterium]|nr:XrtA/PEP-CTERM system TPR-repeat protein PrsT [Gammaproteobacteria bacterium]